MAFFNRHARTHLLVPLSLALAAGAAAAEGLRYPEAPKSDVVEEYPGGRIADPYRWLEDLNAAETKAWVAAQNVVTFGFLEKLPQRAAIRRRLTELQDYPRVSLPLREAGRIFYRRNSGLQKQAPLYVRDSLSGEPSLLIDPNALSPDGSISLAQWSPSPDGRYLAYALSEGGADWAEVHLREVATGKDLPDLVRWFRFSDISWTKDGQGFFYARYPEPPKGEALSAELRDHQVWYHRAGTPQAQDRLIYWRKELPKYFVGAGVTDDGRYLIVTLNNGTDPRNRLFLADLGDPRQPDVTAPVVPIVDEDIAELTVLANDGPVLFARTDLNAPRRRVVAIDTRAKTPPAAWPTIVPESPNALESAVVAGRKLFAQYLVDVKSEVRIFGLDGKSEGTLALPGIVTVAGMSGREKVDELFYVVTSALYPSTVFRYDFGTKASAPFDAARPPFDPDRYETRQVFYPSKDGTRIPMFITSRKGLVLDGSHPAWLYGYGGFAISLTPTYRPQLPAWLEMGGIYAQPSLRGGAEYGEDWHRAGMLDKKQNVFDDFIAAAEYLIREKYTTAARLAIEGGSNGGLLVGAAMTQRPELFGAAIPEVGVLDMLRYERFTGGAAWAVEYGSAQDPKQFPYLRAYSPLHNLKAGTCYPPTLILTNDHDDRVVPSHSYKFAAALQAAQGCDKPVLLRVETQTSHGYRPTDKLIEERADILAFMAQQLGAGKAGATGAPAAGSGMNVR
ncbi:MAG: S9 family peptidase [Acidobacteria bacterium]|nr:MAG: S9 family peptidase [Acidobacteriota bacterium]